MRYIIENLKTALYFIIEEYNRNIPKVFCGDKT